MSKRYLIAGLPLAALTILTGCVDDNYDLANIDTSIEVPVNDLVIPVNVGPVTLNSVIDIKDSESITKEKYIGSDPSLQGKDIYVYNYNGDFDSDEIKINEFSVNAPTDIAPSIVRVDLFDNPAASKRRLPGLGTFSYNINRMSTEFRYDIKDVDLEVRSISEITTPKVTFNTKLQLPANVAAMTKQMELENVRLNFPKGLYSQDGSPAKATMGTYNPETGDIIIKSFKSTDGIIDLTLTAQLIDLEKIGVVLENGHFNYDGEITVESGALHLTPLSDAYNFPGTFDVDIAYNLSSFDISSFSGDIDYSIEGLKFDDAMLNDIPDFLAQDDTRIRIANPQIYLSISNSCAQYGLGGVTGLEVTPYRDNRPGSTLRMNEDIRVGHDKGYGPYQFAISPEGSNLTPIASYTNATKLLFSSLGDVLYGDGIPQKISVAFPDPHVDGNATRFPLGKRLPSIKGSYVFRAPLALADGSQIIYSGTEDDWSSDDLKDLYVKRLEVTADITSTIPLEVRLSAQILNEAGNHMGKCESTPLPALAENYPVTITITPDEGFDYIQDIDGIFYKAWAISNSDASNPGDVPPLSPEQTLTLDNIRVKVSGKYLHLDKDDK
ncbi:MAG: hypothetical protein K2M31_07530 [Muribaculaceae bacterium]|nr:hypothetical protein [Muribaculaceae bacterium]